MKSANRICPNCWNPNYVMFLGDFSKAYKYKCINCNHYFNDVDVNKPSAPIWKTQCVNSKVDMVEVVRCKNCKHRPTKPDDYENGFDLEFPDGKCPCRCSDGWYSWYPPDDWFCADGEKRNEE